MPIPSIREGELYRLETSRLTLNLRPYVQMHLVEVVSIDLMRVFVRTLACKGPAIQVSYIPRDIYPLDRTYFDEPDSGRNYKVVLVPITDLPLYAGYDFLTPRYHKVLAELKT